MATTILPGVFDPRIFDARVFDTQRVLITDDFAGQITKPLTAYTQITKENTAFVSSLQITT